MISAPTLVSAIFVLLCHRPFCQLLVAQAELPRYQSRRKNRLHRSHQSCWNRPRMRCNAMPGILLTFPPPDFKVCESLVDLSQRYKYLFDSGDSAN